MRILSWNIQQGGRNKTAEIINCITTHHPDVVVLTEFGGKNASSIREQLKEAGFTYCSTSNPPVWANGVLIASRFPHAPKRLREDESVEAERRLPVKFSELDLCGLYFPLKDTKEAFWHSVILRAEVELAFNSVLIGDFNTTQHYVDEVGATVPGSIYLDKLRSLGWADAWRMSNSDGREYTWFHQSSGHGFRLDHAWISPPLKSFLKGAWYSHTEREEKISDHSILFVEFNFL